MNRALALAAALFSAAGSAAAQDAVLAKISGPVSYRTEGAARYVAAKGGEELLYGDKVKTGPGGVAHITLKDRGAVLLRENSQLTLQGSESAVRLSVPFGEFLIGLRKRLEKGQSFRVITPASVAAVRGTLFWGKSDESKTSTYAGFGHTVAITAAKKTVILKAGQKVTIPYGQPPSDPEASGISIDYAKNFAIEGSLQDLEALVEPAVETPAPAPAPAPAPDAPKP